MFQQEGIFAEVQAGMLTKIVDRFNRGANDIE